MKFLIIIPAHNEEQNISFCLSSLENQTYKDFHLVVVDDGSSDSTLEIVQDFKENSKIGNKMSVVSLLKSRHEPGAKVVRTFNKGLETQDLKEFDIMCKFDADIIFPENYLEEINRIYQNNPKAGMVSGIVKIANAGFDETKVYDFEDAEQHWKFENISSKNHVRGPIKSYRIECFQAMNGLRPVLGWDNIDVMLSAMHGWEVLTLKDLWVKHLRPTAFQYQKQKAEKLGEYFYNIGLNCPLAIISSAKSSFKNRSFSEFIITMKTFMNQNHPRDLSSDEIKFIRSHRWNQMLKKKKS